MPQDHCLTGEARNVIFLREENIFGFQKFWLFQSLLLYFSLVCGLCAVCLILLALALSVISYNIRMKHS